MKLWLKLNIYSNLLMVIGLSLIIIVLCCEMNWPLKAVCVCGGMATLKFAIKIFGRFEYKKRVFKKMIEKASANYDQRFFIPYMGSPCMRNVVFFALRELNHQSDYNEIARRFKNEPMDKAEFELFERTPPPIIRVSYDASGFHFERVG